MLPTAAVSAAPEPDTHENSMVAITQIMARLPRRWPNNAVANLTSRSDIAPPLITSPASMNSGAAKSGKLSETDEDALGNDG